MSITEKQWAAVVAKGVEEALERAKALKRTRTRTKPREVYHTLNDKQVGCGGGGSGGGCGRQGLYNAL